MFDTKTKNEKATTTIAAVAAAWLNAQKRYCDKPRERNNNNNNNQKMYIVHLSAVAVYVNLCVCADTVVAWIMLKTPMSTTSMRTHNKCLCGLIVFLFSFLFLSSSMWW